MEINTIIQPSVGADLSRPPPIYRPVMPDDEYGRIKYATSIIAPTVGMGGEHVHNRSLAPPLTAVRSAIMQINKLIRPSVGADLSRPPPIYRPVMPGDAHGRIKYATTIIGPLQKGDRITIL